MGKIEFVNIATEQTQKFEGDQARSIYLRGEYGGWKLKNEADRAKLGLPQIQVEPNADSSGNKGDTQKSEKQGDAKKGD